MATVADEIDVEGEVIEVDNSTALMALNKSEIDTQISTAKRYPRSIKRFKDDLLELACLDEETAASMFYVLPRGGKKIEGPSARLAEAVGSCWGNLRYGGRIVSVDETFVTAQGGCFDLEKNIAITVEVKRRITDKHGRRYNEDMISVTSMAAISIAIRNAVFKIVPFALVKGVYEQAKLTSIGKASSMAEKRQKAIDWFLKAGATVEQVLSALGREGVDDIDTDDLITLRGLCTAIRDGESTIEQALGPAPDPKARVRRSDLNDKMPDDRRPHTTPTDAQGPTESPEATETTEETPFDASESQEPPVAAEDESQETLADQLRREIAECTYQQALNLKQRIMASKKQLGEEFEDLYKAAGDRAAELKPSGKK